MLVLARDQIGVAELYVGIWWRGCLRGCGLFARKKNRFANYLNLRRETIGEQRVEAQGTRLRQSEASRLGQEQAFLEVGGR